MTNQETDIATKIRADVLAVDLLRAAEHLLGCRLATARIVEVCGDGGWMPRAACTHEEVLSASAWSVIGWELEIAGTLRACDITAVGLAHMRKAR
jgi:hypothetical protein